MASFPLFPKWGSITAGTEAAEARTLTCKGTKWSDTYRSVNPRSPFRPQEANKAFDSSARDLEPLLRNKGHGDQLSLGGGGSEGEARAGSGLTMIKQVSAEPR